MDLASQQVLANKFGKITSKTEGSIRPIQYLRCVELPPQFRLPRDGVYIRFIAPFRGKPP
jgi:hypothetical protein